MQGESLSPFFYAMYVNDIEIELIKQGCQSYELKILLNLYLLMYADDTVLFSENVQEFQNMINYICVKK
jgi:ASC-1-like (ASCH) protein